MGNSANTMTEESSGDRIRFAPPSPKLMKDDRSQWLRWEMEPPREIDVSEGAQLSKSLVRPGIQTAFDVRRGKHVEMEVRQDPIGDYTRLYEASLRALYHLEQLVGPLVSIEGRPRSEWHSQFVLAKRFGALD